MTKAAVSLCMIVRNEEANLADCLAGVASLVREVIIVDTGSTDGTKRLAASLGAKVFDFPWRDDFAAARNECLRHATGDYILWVDADDRIDAINRERLARLIDDLPIDAQSNRVFVMSCASKRLAQSIPSTFIHIRLFPNRSEFSWNGRVHERVECKHDSVEYAHTDVVIHHVGYENSVQESRKALRNLRILEQDYLVNPEDSWTLFYLGRIRSWQGRPSDALRFVQKSIDLDRAGRLPTTPQAYFIAADCLKQLQKASAALHMANDGLARFSDYIPLLYIQSHLLHECGRLADAERTIRKLLRADPLRWAPAGVFPDLQGSRSRLMLGQILHSQGRLPEAEAECHLALAEDPQSSDAWFLLGQLKFESGSVDGMDAIVRSLDQCPDGAYSSAVLRGQLCIVNQRYEEGRRLLKQAIRIFPDGPAAHVVLKKLSLHETRYMEKRDRHINLPLAQLANVGDRANLLFSC